MAWPSIDQFPPPPADLRFVLEPLGPQHNERDHVAWMTSIEHIHATPGFSPAQSGDDSWPMAMTLDQNMGDLQLHAAEFAAGEAYAYSVIDPATHDVIGCVYIDPDIDPDIDTSDSHIDTSGSDNEAAQAVVRSWVRVDRAELDAPLAGAVADWLQRAGVFRSVRWPGRPDLTS
jgi:hypothetical protein